MDQLKLTELIEVLRALPSSVESRGLTLAAFLNSNSRTVGARTLVTMTGAEGYVVRFEQTTLRDQIDEFGFRRTHTDTHEFEIDLSPAK